MVSFVDIDTPHYWGLNNPLAVLFVTTFSDSFNMGKQFTDYRMEEGERSFRISGPPFELGA